MARREYTTPSFHCNLRMQERQIPRDVVDFVVGNGSKIRVRGGGFAWFLKHRDIPTGVPSDYVRKADGVVAIEFGSTIVTTYRDRNFLKKMKRRSM